MKILNTDSIRYELENNLSNTTINRKILLISRNPSKEATYYKKMIIKRAKEFNIDYIDKVFTNESEEEILEYINSYDRKNGFIILSPFGDEDKLQKLRSDIKLLDLDSFTYKSLAKAIRGEYESLPATVKSIIKFLNTVHPSLKGIKIVIVNNSTIIGKPLACYLTSMGATVSILNSKTKNQGEYIKNADVFISAIGRAKYYDKSFFSNECLIIDVGTTIVDGKITGDVDYDTFNESKVEILTIKKGIGSITTLCLLESLII